MSTTKPLQLPSNIQWQHWVERWDNPRNQAVVARVREFAMSRGITPRAVNIAWVLNQGFSCIGIAPLSSIGTAHATDYESGSRLILQPGELDWLRRNPRSISI